MRLSAVLEVLREAAQNSKRYSERHFDAFGYLALFLIPATTLVEHLVAEPLFNTVYVRLVAAMAGGVLLFRRRLPAVLRKNFEVVWVFLATVILPVSFGLLLTLNAALAAPNENLPPIWIYQYLVAVFIFVQVMHHAALSISLWLLAGIPLALSVLFIDAPNLAALKEAWLLPLPVYLTALIIGSFANRNVQMIESEKLRAASAIGSNLAHELRTPLASIGIISRAVQRHLPPLVDAYELSLEHSDKPAQIGKAQIYELRRALRTIQEEVAYSNTMINISLANTSDSPVESRNPVAFFASQAIAEAVSRYPFNNSDEQRILESCTQSDFMVRAPYILVVHVLFNLLKNAVYYTQGNPLGVVKVFTGVYRGKNAIIVADTGSGIAESVKQKVFDRFFTTTEAGQGAGIGLSFCKMVMEGIGGEIVCDSKEGEYTTFRLLFPEVS